MIYLYMGGEGGFELIKQRDVDPRIRRERGAPVQSREWGNYPFIFRLPQEPRYWNNKIILDVGSGNKWDDPSETFPGAKVCAIDPEFGRGGRIDWNTADETVPGIVQNIPYPNGSFDHVLSSHAIPQHVFPIDMPRAVYEMLRVMKPTGDVRMAPCVERDIQSIESLLQAAGFEVDLSRSGSDGPITIIRAAPRIRNDMINKERLKAEALRLFQSSIK